jgi:hypothetical protein
MDRQMISAKDVELDFAYLYESLQRTHYNLFAFRSKKDYDSLYHAKSREIAGDSLSLLQTVTFFQSLVSYSNTGHCEIDFPAQSYIQYAYTGGTVFPLELAFEDGKVYVRKNMSSDSSLKEGIEVLTIDHVPVNEFQKRFYEVISAENEYSRNAKLEFWSFPRLYYQIYGSKSEWRIQIRLGSGGVESKVVSAVSVIEYESRRGGEVVSPRRDFKYFGKTAYLSPGSFGGTDDGGESAFKRFIDSAFLQLRLHATRTLVIDLRNHPGGHNVYSDFLISYFARRPFKWHSGFALKTSEILKRQTRLQADTTDGYSRAILSNGDGAIFSYDFGAQHPAPASKRFHGKVYVLVNRQTYSMAAVAAALIQDYKFGTIVGEETGDPPTLYASQFSYTLPRTGIVVEVPKGYIIRPNGDRSFGLLKPDILIKDHLLDGVDEGLTGILRKIDRHR